MSMLDYTGINPKFKVKNELITPSSLVGNRYSPVKGAFYANSIALTKLSDGQPFTDITFKELDVLNTGRAAVSAGPIYFILEFPNGVPEDLYLTYQVVDLSNDPKSVELERALKNLDLLNRTYRIEDIDGERPVLPTKKHQHKLPNNIVGPIANALLGFLPKEVEEIKTTFASLLAGYLKSDVVISGENPESLVGAINAQFNTLASLLQQLDGALATNPGGLDTNALSIVGAINEILVSLTSLGEEVNDQLKVSPLLNSSTDLTPQMDGTSKFWLVNSLESITLSGDFLDGTTEGTFINGDMVFYDSTTNKLVKRNPNSKITEKQPQVDQNIHGSNKDILSVLHDLWNHYITSTTGTSPIAVLDGNNDITNLRYCTKVANLTTDTTVPIDSEYFGYYLITCEPEETVAVTGPWRDGDTTKVLNRGTYIVYQDITATIEVVDAKEMGTNYTGFIDGTLLTENKAIDRAINELYLRLTQIPTEDVTLVGQLWDEGFDYLSSIDPNPNDGVYYLPDAELGKGWVIDVPGVYVNAKYENNGDPIEITTVLGFGSILFGIDNSGYWDTQQVQFTDYKDGRVILIDTNIDQPVIHIGGEKTEVIIYNDTVVDNTKVSGMSSNYKLLSSIAPNQEGNRVLPAPGVVENYIVDVEDGLVEAFWYNQGSPGTFLVQRTIGELIVARPDKANWDVTTQGTLVAHPHAIVYYDPVTSQPTLLTPDISDKADKLTYLAHQSPGTKNDVIDVINDIHKTNTLVVGDTSINFIGYLTGDTDLTSECVGSIDKQWVVVADKIEVIAPFENETSELEVLFGSVLYYSGSTGEVSIGDIKEYPLGYAREYEPDLTTTTKNVVGAIAEVERTVNATGYRTGDIFHSYREFIPEVAIPLGSAPVSRSVYANLFATIGTTFGEGDGSTTFGIPLKTKSVLKGKLLPSVGIGSFLTNRPSQDVPANRVIHGCSSVIAYTGGFVTLDVHVNGAETINDSTLTLYTSLGHVFNSTEYTSSVTISKYDKPFAYKYPGKDILVVRRGEVWTNISLKDAVGYWGDAETAIDSASPEFLGSAYDSVSEELFTLRADPTVVYGPNITIERRRFVEQAIPPIEETWNLVKPDNGYINDLARVDGTDYLFVAETTGLYRVNLLTNSYVKIPLEYQEWDIVDIRALVYDKDLDILYLSGGDLGVNGESVIYSLTNPTTVNTGTLALYQTGIDNLTIKGLTIHDGAVSYVGNNPSETTKLSTLAAHLRSYNIEDSNVPLLKNSDIVYGGDHSGVVDESVVFTEGNAVVSASLYRDDQLVTKTEVSIASLPVIGKSVAAATYFDKYGKWFYLHNVNNDTFVSYFNRDGSRATWSFTAANTIKSLASAPGSDYIATIAAPSADANGTALFCMVPDPRPDVDGSNFSVTLGTGALGGHVVQASDGDTHYYVTSSLVSVGDGLQGRPIREIKNTRSNPTEQVITYLPSSEVPVKTSYHYELDWMLIATNTGNLYCFDTKTRELTLITANQFQNQDMTKRLSLTSGGTNGDLALADSGTGQEGIRFYDFHREPTQFIRT